MGDKQSKTAGPKGARKGTPAAQPKSVFAALKSTQPTKDAPQVQACVAAPKAYSNSAKPPGREIRMSIPKTNETPAPVCSAPVTTRARNETTHSSAIEAHQGETREERRKRIMEAQKAAMWSDDEEEEEEEASEQDSDDSAESSDDATETASKPDSDLGFRAITVPKLPADASDASAESRESAASAKSSASQKLVDDDGSCSDMASDGSGESEADEVSEKSTTSEVPAAKSSVSRKSVGGDAPNGSENAAEAEADEVSEKPETSEATAVIVDLDAAIPVADVQDAVSEQPEASEEEAEDSDEESEDSDDESGDSDEESSTESDDSDDMVRQDTGPKQAACLYSGVQDVKWAHVSHPKSMLFTYGMSGPAVGSYSPKPIVKKTRTHAFGKTKVVRKQRCYGLNRHTPGPGSYGTVFSSFSPKRSAGWGKSTTSRFGTPKCYGMSVRKPLRNTRMGKPKYGFMAPTKLTQIRHSSLHGTPAPAPKRRRAATKPASANKRSARKPKKLPKKIKPKRAPAVVKTKKTRKPKSPKKHRPTLPRITEEESNSESEASGESEEESEGAESEEKSEEAEAEAEESEEESEESAEESEEESEESEEESEESSDDSGSGSDCDDMSDMDSILALIASHGL